MTYFRDYKISAAHLNRPAVLYLRQSSERQVKKHAASVEAQRAMAGTARQCGWSAENIVIIDRDLGITGTDVAEREGFKWMREQIFRGNVGAVLCLEISRLARDILAYSHLVKLCAACNTLVIDENGVHDPNNDDDHLFLSIMGVLSEHEGRRLAAKFRSAKRVKAEAGKLRQTPPTGYLYDAQGKLSFDPDERVRQAINLFFSTYDRLGSAFKVCKYFTKNNIAFPLRDKSRAKNYPLQWGMLSMSRTLYILHNPAYAGAYVHGLSRVKKDMMSADSMEQKKRAVKVALNDERVILIRDAHEGYIAWDQFIKNVKRLDDNRYVREEGSRGAARDGSALLSGLVTCGPCERKMHTSYWYKDGSKLPSYLCDHKARQSLGPVCQSVLARRVDRLVTRLLLEAVTPAQLELSLHALGKVREREQEEDRYRLLQIEQAKFEAGEAKARFELVNPRNRVVADFYEDELERKLVEIKRLEEEREQALAQRPRMLLNPDMRQSILALPQNLAAIWSCDAVTGAERKEVARALIEKVVITRESRNKPTIQVTVHWKTGVLTHQTVLVDKQLDPDAVTLLRRLAPDHTIAQMVEILNSEGFRTPKGGKEFTVGALWCHMKSNGIALGCPETNLVGTNATRGDGRYSTSSVARMAGVTVATVSNWCKKGLLDFVRSSLNGPRWIKTTPEQIAEIKKGSSRLNCRTRLDEGSSSNGLATA